MRVFAIADPHLSLGTPEKEMDRFGPHWADHARRIEVAWRETVADEDLVVVAGDISWAMRLEQARLDLAFLAALPGTKAMIKGNHDYWWQSTGKVRAVLPERFHAIDADAVEINGTIICGTRLWDVPGVSFDDLITWQDEPAKLDSAARADRDASQSDTSHIYPREVGRLERALKHATRLKAEARATQILVMTHYPPCNANLAPNELTELFEQHGVSDVIFGHLHDLRPDAVPFGERNGVRYHLTACDWLGFRPLLIPE